MFGTAFSNESSHRVYRRKPLVSRTDGATADLFDVIEEASQYISRQIEYIEAVDVCLTLAGSVRKEKGECVAIASLRVSAEVAFRNQMIKKKAFHPCA
jgi:hypothetical protein